VVIPRTAVIRTAVIAVDSRGVEKVGFGTEELEIANFVDTPEIEDPGIDHFDMGSA
jgi:hypothetical protein